MTPAIEQIVEIAMSRLIAFIAEEIETQAGRDLAEQMVLDKLEFRRKAQAMLDERRKR